MCFLVICMSSLENAFFFAVTLCVFFSRLSLLRLSMATAKISLGKCHITLENMRVIFSYLLILISNIISYSDKRTDTMISILLEHEISVPCFMSFICSSVTWFIVYGNLNRIYILQLCENCINLNYVELVHSVFKVCYTLLLFLCSFY